MSFESINTVHLKLCYVDGAVSKINRILKSALILPLDEDKICKSKFFKRFKRTLKF
jgi:hypothetical protein